LIVADVVVINHTLLFMLLGSPEEQEERDEGYLFPNDFIIFDEAHTIEQVASRQIGIGISQYGLRATIQRLYNARSKKGLFTVTRDAREGISVFLQQSAEEYVYWIERTGKAARNITLNAAPIDVAPVLRRMLFRDDCTSVMTSATLAVGRPDLAYFRRRIGADDAEPLQLGSPFDFQKQMKLFVVRKMPDPRDDGYCAALAEWVARFVEDTDGRAFVLFTSYRSMQQLALEMESFFVRQKMNLLVQGRGAPRSQLLEQFKTTPRSVLFGTDSFWMGVDVPGDALSNVIITRLPFAVPDHPLIEAKLELIQARGGDAFTEYSLPEAILKFRQGVGRLIRTKSDSGIVVILDNRIVTKTYGRAFLKALPECPVKIL
jgi:ATP-dependent DNA helicase DinG